MNTEFADWTEAQVEAYIAWLKRHDDEVAAILQEEE